MQNIKCQRICLNQIRQKLGYCLSIIKCSDGGTLHCGCPNFSSVSIVTSAEWPRNHGSIPGRGTRLFFSPNHLDHFCGQPSLLFNGYWAFLNREYSRRGVKLTTHLHLQCLLKNACSYTSHIVVLIKHSTSVLLYGLRRSIYIQKKKRCFRNSICTIFRWGGPRSLVRQKELYSINGQRVSMNSHYTCIQIQ